MKHTILRRALALLLTLMLALSLTACGDDSKEPHGSAGKLDPKTDKDTSRTDDEGFSELAQAALDDLCSHRQQEYLAAAFLGEREKDDTTSLSAWLNNNCPDMVSIWPFLQEIGEKDIVGDYGDLYCIVPLVESAQVAVKSVEWEVLGNGLEPHYSDPLYSGEVGKPFLVYIGYAEIVPNEMYETDTVIEYTRDDGYANQWGPEHQWGAIYRPSDNGHDSVMDFSLLYGVGDYLPYMDYDSAPDAEWLPPTDMGLAGTKWESNNGWAIEFTYDEYADNVSGVMALYEPVEDAYGSIYRSLYFESTWWISYDCLSLGYYDGNCPFPLLISPSGEELVIMKSDDGSVLPFFEPGQSCVTLDLTYN